MIDIDNPAQRLTDIEAEFTAAHAEKKRIGALFRVALDAEHKAYNRLEFARLADAPIQVEIDGRPHRGGIRRASKQRLHLVLRHEEGFIERSIDRLGRLRVGNALRGVFIPPDMVEKAIAAFKANP